MIERLLEAFFRHWMLILLPIVVIPLDVAAYVLATPPQYEAEAGIWVERPTYLVYSSGDLNQYLTAAQNQRNRLTELMQTRSFRGEVTGKTALATMSAQPDGDELIAQMFARDFDAVATGDHLLVLRYRAEDRAVAGDVVNSIIAAFRNRSSADRLAQAEVAITFYQGQVTQSEGALATARADLARYLAANPTTAATLARGGTDAARIDSQFAELQRHVDSVQSDADANRASLDRARADVLAGTQGDELSFRITDPTKVSATASRQVKRTLLYPIAALIGGVILAAALLLFFGLSDHSVRSLADLAPDLVILGALPRLSAPGVSGRPRDAIIRRGVASLAGAVIAGRGIRRAS